MGKTLYEKVFDLHTVRKLPSGQHQLMMGVHLVHEVTSPQAFSMLEQRGLNVLYPERTFATVDHIIAAQADDVVVIFARGRFHDARLRPLNPLNISAGRRVILVVDPKLPMSEALAARGRINASDLVVSTMDEK